LALVIGLVAPLEAGIEYRARTWQEGEQKNKQAETSVKASVDGDKAKIVFEDSGNPSMPAGSYLLTTDGGETIYLVRPQDKTYGEFDLEAVMQLLNAFGESGMIDIQIDNPQLVKLATGPGKSVAGVDAKHARYGMSYEMRMKIIGIKKTQTVETVQDIWYTDAMEDAGLSVWVRKKLPKTGTDLDELIALEASKIKGFPLETVETMTTTGKKGKQTTTTTHTLVSDLRQGVSFSGDTFVIPDDYTPVDMMPTGAMMESGDQQPQQEGEEEEEKGGMLGRFKKFGKKKG
jgi:hypothetical protein